MESNPERDRQDDAGNQPEGQGSPDPVWHVSTFDPKTLQPLPAPQALKGLADAIASHLNELEEEIDESGPAYAKLEVLLSRFAVLKEYIAAQPKLLPLIERRKVDNLFKDQQECLAEIEKLRPGLSSQVQDLQSKTLLCKVLFRDTEAEWSLA